MKKFIESKNTFLKTMYSKILIAVAVLVLVISAYFISINSQVKKWDKLIYPGVIVDEINLGGNTKEEATELINKEISSKIGDKNINVKLGNEVKTYKYSEIGASCDIEKIVDDAFNYGKNLSLIKKNKLIKKGKIINIGTALKYDEGKLGELEDKIIQDTKKEAKDATISINQGQINITKEEEGYEIDKKSLHSKLIEVLNCRVNSDTDITVEAKKINPKITEKMLSEISSTPMSTYSTSYASSSFERSKNLEIVTSLINGTVLMPGEEFSYSEVSQRGRGEYLDAPVYINNKVEKAEAGGICQVSSTLYNAVMRANIRSVERTNHSLTVSYVPYGLDATVAWGYLDYKFKNTYDFPIYIEGISSNRMITFNIYGNPSALNGVKYELTSNIIERIEPEITYVDDPTLKKGVEVIESNGQVGYIVESFIVGYKNGVEISREFLDKDTYANTKTVVRRGTAEEIKEEVKEEVKEEATEEVKEENTDNPQENNKVEENNNN